MYWLTVLGAEMTALLSFLLFTYLSKIRSRYAGTVQYPPNIREMRRYFTLTVFILFHQIAFAIWQLTLFNLQATTPDLRFVVKVGVCVTFLGLVLYRWALHHMHRVVLPPMSIAPKAEAVLVTTGPYQFSRNPMYVSYLLSFIGIQLATLSPGLFFAPIVFGYFEDWVHAEEQHQLGHHGEQYQHYLDTTARWFSPACFTRALRRALYLY